MDSIIRHDIHYVGGEEWEMSRTGDYYDAANAPPVPAAHTPAASQRSWVAWTQDSEISFDPVYMDGLVEAGVIARSPLEGAAPPPTSPAAAPPSPSGAPPLTLVPPSPLQISGGTSSNASSTITCAATETSATTFEPTLSTPDQAAALDFDFFQELIVKPRSSVKAKEERRKVRRIRLKRALLKAKNADNNASAARVVVGKQGQVVSIAAGGGQQSRRRQKIASAPERTLSTPTNKKDLLALVASMRAELAAKDVVINRLNRELIQQKRQGSGAAALSGVGQQQQLGKLPGASKLKDETPPKLSASAGKSQKGENMPFKEMMRIHRGTGNQENVLLLHAKSKLRKSNESAMTPRRRALAQRNKKDKVLSRGGGLLLYSKMFLRRRQLISGINGDTGQSPGSFGTPV
jgi:hypothetical protein